MNRPSHFLINSDYRDFQSQSHSNFSFTLPTSIENAERMILVGAKIPATFYNIQSGYNDTFTLNSILITIPEGLYNLIELGAVIEAQLISNISLAAFTVGFDPVLMKVFINSNSITSFSLDFTNSMSAFILGFRQQAYSGAVIFSDFPPNVHTLSILIHMDCSSGMLTNNKLVNSASFIIDNNVNKGEYIFHHDKTHNQQVSKASSQLFKNVRVRVTDVNGKELKNLGPWQMVIQFDFRSDVNINLCSN